VIAAQIRLEAPGADAEERLLLCQAECEPRVAQLARTVEREHTDVKAHVYNGPVREFITDVGLCSHYVVGLALRGESAH
jgi:hypothetical protein